VTGWEVAWLAFAAVFLAIEIPAWLDRKPGGTLSELVWGIFAIRSKPRFWRLRRATLALLLAMLTYHLLAGGGWLVVD
jgi:hypothetical protein